MNGTFYRLISPFESEEAAWIVVSEDKKHALAGYYRMRQPANAPLKRLVLKGLDKDICYKVVESGMEFGGDELMHAGMAISDFACGIRKNGERQGDYQSRLFELTALS